MERGFTMKKLVLHGRKVVGGSAEGEALVTKHTISGWGGIDPIKGIILERRHELRNQSFKDKVLVFPSGKGSSGWSITFHVTRLAATRPKAMIIKEVNSLTGLGAVVMNVPTVTELDQDPGEVIHTGDWVKVDADRGLIEVTSEAK
jgi:predicted aconitase with swiveling domain